LAQSVPPLHLVKFDTKGKMRLAIPTFGSRVSPRFDCSHRMLLVDIEGGRIVGRREIDVSYWHPLSQIDRLHDLKADTVICGGICNRDYYGLSNGGIKVITLVFGEVEEVVKAFLNGDLVGSSLRFRGRRQRRRCEKKCLHGRIGCIFYNFLKKYDYGINSVKNLWDIDYIGSYPTG
jgi:predicted Fe-Mo cluster-binding NifX family protein